MKNEREDKGFFGHPIGLSTLFFTEFWERFSYYGMKAILIYYIYDAVSNGGLGLPKTTAASIVAIYGSLIYMSGAIGGWISDRLLGSRRTVFLGGILIMIGHIVLATPFGFSALLISIAFLVLGTGLLKPNISEMVGSLYSEEDTRRDAGFSIFVMGINLGSLLAPIVIPFFKDQFNYHVGFSIAAIGMFFGLIQYYFQGKKHLSKIGMEANDPMDANQKKKAGGIVVAVIVAATVLALIAKQFGLLTIENVILVISIIGILVPICYFVIILRSKKIDETERSRVWAYVPLFIAAMFFWSIEEQGSVILALFAKDRTQLDLFGIALKPEWAQLLNPFFVIVLAPLAAMLWMKLGKRQPSTSIKFSLGLIFSGLSFVVMMLPGILNGTDVKASALWLILSFLLVIIGEVCLSPVGMSITTKVAPKAFHSQMMSMWFLNNAAAQAVNAQLVRLYTPQTEVMYFGIVGTVTIVLGVILILISPKIKSMMRGLL